MALDDLVHGIEHRNVRVQVKVAANFVIALLIKLRLYIENSGEDLLHLSNFNAFCVFVLYDGFKNAWQALDPGDLQLNLFGQAHLVLDLEQDVAESLSRTYV